MENEALMGNGASAPVSIWAKPAQRTSTLSTEAPKSHLNEGATA